MPEPRGAAGAPLIEFESLVHVFPDGRRGLDGVTLSIRAGEFVVIAGRNGAGKSLLMRHAIGLARPTSGSVRVGGEKPGGRQGARLGYVFQDADSQLLGSTVLDDACFGPANWFRDASEARRRGREALERAGLADLAARRPDSLSGGEKRALSIAGAMALEPEALVLDEPFANLDCPSIRTTLRLVLDVHGRGVAVVVLTHELEKTLAHATRLVVMEGGRVGWEGAPRDFPRSRFEEFGLRDPYAGATRFEDLTWLR